MGEQSHELGARFLTNTNWKSLGSKELQTVIELPPAELGLRFTAFLRAGAPFVGRELGVLKMTAAAVGEMKQFGEYWRPWCGPLDGDGLTGKAQTDMRGALLDEVDFRKVEFATQLRPGESRITGFEKLEREKKDGRLRLGWRAAGVLKNEPEQLKLRALYDAHGVGWMEFTGTLLRADNGEAFFLCLVRRNSGAGEGTWFYHARKLEEPRTVHNPSILLPI